MQEAAEAVFSTIAKERGGASWCESKAAVGGLPLNNLSVFGMPNSRFSETAISIIPGVAEKRTSNPLGHERKVDDVRQEAATVALSTIQAAPAALSFSSTRKATCLRFA
jgi:hypothetical protein